MFMLFSLNGRIGRLQYWLTSIGILLFYCMICVAVDVPVKLGLDILTGQASPNRLPNFSMSEIILISVSLMFATAINISAIFRRYHDRNKTGWWILISFVPIIGPIWQFVELAFLAGTPGGNDFDLQIVPKTLSSNYASRKTQSSDSLDDIIQLRLAKIQQKGACNVQHSAPSEPRKPPAGNDRPIFGRLI